MVATTAVLLTPRDHAPGTATPRGRRRPGPREARPYGVRRGAATASERLRCVTLSPARSRGPEPGSGRPAGGGPVPGARRALVLLAVFSIVSFGDKAVLGLAGPRMIEDLGLTNAQFGLIGSSFYLLFSIS